MSGSTRQAPPPSAAGPSPGGPPPPEGRYPLPFLLLGLLVPGVVLGMAWWALTLPPVPHGHAATFDKRLAEHPPSVVVLGSSLANRGVDIPVLARELGIRNDEVALLQLPHASAAHWYAILENRVFGPGYRPRLVVVAGALTTMLNHDNLQYEANVERLVEQMGPHEPVIARKVFGRTDEEVRAQHAVREAAGQWRARLLEAYRDRLVTWLFTKKGKLEEGQRLVEQVNEEVFSNDAMDYSLHRRPPSASTSPSGADVPTGDDFVLREHGLIEDFAELVDAHGARLVYVRMPFPPSNPNMDVVPAPILDDALAWMEEVGSGYLDLRGLDLSDEDFEDMRHLSRKGAASFTMALARSLIAMGALDGEGDLRVVRAMDQVPAPQRGDDWPALPLLTGQGCRRTAPAGALRGLTAERLAPLPLGTEPPLTVTTPRGPVEMGAPGEGCVGRWWIEGEVLVVSPQQADDEVALAWGPARLEPTRGGPMTWVLPGSSVHFDVPDGWALPPRTFAAIVRGVAVGPGAAQGLLEVHGVQEPLQARQGRLVGIVRPEAPKGPWSLTVSVPEGAPAVLLHHVAVGLPPTTLALLGAAETLHGASVRLVGGRLDDTRSEATYAGPPVMDALAPTLKRGPRQMAFMAVPRLADLADAADKDASRPSQCSPVRVLEDGTPMPHPHSVCFDAMMQGGGRACHAGPNVWFTASDATSPVDNGRTYTLALDPDRSCDTWIQRNAATLRGSWWLYPSDAATFRVPPKRLGTFRDGANRLVLEVVPLVAPAELPLQVRLLADGQVVLDTTWLPEGPQRKQLQRAFSLDPPLAASVQDLQLELAHPSSQGFLLLTMAALEEHHGEVIVPPLPAAAPTRARAADAVGRDGAPPALPPVVMLGPGELGTTEAKLFPLWPVSTSSLEKLGLGPLSPLRLAADGEPLLPIGSKKVFKAGCDRCFMHLGQAVVFRAPRGAQATLSASLDDAFPMEAGQGSRAWWVYPGQTAWWSFAAPWAGEQVQARAQVWALNPQREEAGDGLFLGLDGVEQPFTQAVGASRFTATVQVDATGEGTWRVALRNASERSFVLVDTLEVVDAEGNARVVPAAPAPDPLR